MGPLEPGSTLSQKYRVVRLMAESGGVVLYEASVLEAAASTGGSAAQRVLIKVLSRDALLNADALERFQLEASGAKVLDVGKSADGLPYVVANFEGKAVVPEAAKSKPAPPAVPRPPASAPRAPIKPSPAKSTTPDSPKALGVKPMPSAKSTLVGVPPPANEPAHDDTPPPSSSVPLQLEDADLISDRQAPAAAKPKPPSPPVLLPDPTPTPPPVDSPFVKSEKAIVWEEPEARRSRPPPESEPAPKKSAPPLLHKRPPEVEEEKPEPIVALFSTPPAAALETPATSTAPPPEPKPRSGKSMWIALPFVAALTGVAGWYLGHNQSAATHETVATTPETHETVTAPKPTAAATPTTTTPMAPETSTSPSTATATATPPATVALNPPEPHAPPPVRTSAPPPITTTATRPPPAATHRPPAHTSSDPLTL